MNKLKPETEKKIIQSAHDVFVEKGMDGARMQEIADRAGINKALLHYYFRSKDQLFEAVFKSIFNKIIPEFAKILKQEQTLEELVRTFVVFYNQLFQQNPYLPQFFFHEIWQNPDRLTNLVKSNELDPGSLVEILNKRLPGLVVSNYKAQHVIANVVGVCLFPHIGRPLFQRLFFEGDREEYDQFLAERTQIILDLIKPFIVPIESKTDEKSIND